MSLLYSQIGYEAGSPVRVLFRQLPGGEEFPMELFARHENGESWILPVESWGARWGSHWGVATLRQAEAGEVELRLKAEEIYPLGRIQIGEDRLWGETFEKVALLQGERRMRFAFRRPGWRDCGSWLQEANSHAVYLMGLLDVWELRGGELDGVERQRGPQGGVLTDAQRQRLSAQIENGLMALAEYQDLAREKGLGEGALVHEPRAQAEVVMRNDAIKAALVFARAGNLGSWEGDWTSRARAAFVWAEKCGPFRPETLESRAHGVAAGYEPWGEAWQTCDLFMMASVALELAETDPEFAGVAKDYLRRGMARQVLNVEGEPGHFLSSPKGEVMPGLTGYFDAFGDGACAEKAWTHHGISYDTGQTFAHWLFPLVEALRRWPDEAESDRWRECLRVFAEGYLISACRQNPFLICPLGLFEGELLEFAGLWHGMNAVYGFTAALCLELIPVIPELREPLEEIATGNLQWIAGLNAGVTADSLTLGSHMFSMDVPEGRALPVSMIYGVGERWAGSWTTVPGSITNGFSTGDQFRFDVEPVPANDGPHAFNDEEWITHAGGWLAGLARWKKMRLSKNERAS